MSFVNRGTHEGLGLFFPGPESEVIHIELPVGSAADRPRPHRPSSLLSISALEADLPSLASPLQLTGWKHCWLNVARDFVFSESRFFHLLMGVVWAHHVRWQWVKSRVCLTHGFVPKKTMTQCWCLLHVACLSSYCMYSCVSCIVFSTAVGF